MTEISDQDFVHKVISSSRYLTLATCDGLEPWAAPIEFLCDDELNFFFLSTDDSLHSRQIARNPEVALALFEAEQPEYSANLTARLRGVQIRATATRLSQEDYPESVTAAIEALNPPMPPYGVFKVSPVSFFLPKIMNGVNERVEVKMR